MHILDLDKLRSRGFDSDTFSDAELYDAEENTWRLIELFINRKLDVSTELKLDGEDSQVLPLPTQVVSLDSVTVTYGDESETVPVSEIAVYNRNVPSDYDDPKIVWKDGIFPQGYQNVTLSGQFGYVEGDLEVEPLMEACMRLMYLQFQPLVGGSGGAASFPNPDEIKEEITDRYSYVKFDRDTVDGLFSDQLVNAILQKYCRGSDVLAIGWV